MHRLRLLWASQCTLSYSVCMYPIFLYPTVGVPFICNRASAAMANNLTRGSGDLTRPTYCKMRGGIRDSKNNAIPSN